MTRPAVHLPPGPSVATMVLIYAALMMMLLLTVGAAHLPLGPLALLIALGIAGAKAALVVLFFMHLKYAERATWVFAATGLLWLGILFTLTFSDYFSRGWLYRSEELSSHHPLAPPRGIPQYTPEGPRVPFEPRRP